MYLQQFNQLCVPLPPVTGRISSGEMRNLPAIHRGRRSGAMSIEGAAPFPVNQVWGDSAGLLYALMGGWSRGYGDERVQTE